MNIQRAMTVVFTLFVLVPRLLLQVEGSSLIATEEFTVNQVSHNGLRDPSVATYPSGDFIVVWKSEFTDGDGFMMKLYDITGTPKANEKNIVKADESYRNQLYP